MNIVRWRLLTILTVWLLAVSLAAQGQEASPASQPAGPVALVFVPPAGPDALLVLGDLLAAELGRSKSIRVVDRTQIERILAEKLSGDQPAEPAQSYDLMVRLRVDAVRTSPALVIELIDLSTGNIRAAREFPWSARPDDQQVTEMAKLCQAEAAKVERGEKRRLRVRLLGVDNPGHRMRLEPLAQQLVTVMEAMVGRSPRCQLVRHVEALTAKEESLLLYAGLSRLAGGREFLPQADTTIEAAIRETDIVGKTFDETPLEVSWSLTSRGRPRGEPATLKGTVKEWPSLARQFGEKLAAQLGETSPVPFGDVAVEMVRRRQQAEVELAAAMKEMAAAWAGSSMALNRELTTTDGSFKIHPALQRIAVAAKLDPTYEEAAYLLANYGCKGAYLENSDAARAWSIKECLRYLQRFSGHPKHRKDVFAGGICMATSYFIALRYDSDKPAPLSPQHVEMLGVLQQIMADMPIRSSDRSARDVTCMGVNLVRHGLRAMGLPRDERDRWLADYVEQYERKVGADEIELKVFQLKSAIDDHDSAAARSLAEEILARHPSGSDMVEWPYHRWEAAHKEFVRLNDPELQARLKVWIETQIAAIKDETTAKYARQWLKQTYPGPWPVPPPPMTEEQRQAVAEELKKSQLPNWPEMIEYLDIRDQALRLTAPLMVHNNVLYLAQRGGWNFVPGMAVTSPPPKGVLLRVPVNAAGRVAGKPEPLPESPQAFNLVAFTAAGSRVYFSLLGDGLREFDSATGKWRSWNVAHGLPTVDIPGLFVLDEKTLLLTGTGGNYRDGFLCTLNLESSQVKVLFTDKLWGNMPRLESLWQSGDKYLSITGDGRILDGLSGKRVRGFAIKPDGWSPDGLVRMATVGHRRWVGLDGLYEINDQGDVICSYFGQALRPPALNLIPPVEIETDQRSLKLAHDETHLYLVTDGQVACYDPAADMWYGPLSPGTDMKCAVSAAGGIWVGAGRGPGFIDTAKFIAAAEARGLARKSYQVEPQKP